MDRLTPLVTLKLRLMFRQGRGAGQVIAWAVLMLLFIVPVGLGAAAFGYAGFSMLDAAGDQELLVLLLAGVWAFWVLFPLLGFSLNQSYDLTRLFIYPLRRATIFLGNVLACFLDPALLLVLPFFGVVVYFLSTSAAATLAAVLALLLFLAHTIAFSQAVLWALLNILRSRRVRDWALLLAPLIALALYVSPHLFVRSAVTGQPFQTLVAWHPSRYLGFTPAGLAAGALEAAARGRWLLAFAYLGGQAACVLAALAAGAFVLGRLHAGELGAYAAPRREEERAGVATSVARLATTPLAALILKELRYYWRDPRLKSIFIVPLFPLVFVLGSSVIGRHGAMGFGPAYGVIFTAAFTLLGFSSLFQNIFGYDREGLRLLFVTPCSREAILLGKNAAGVAVAWIGASTTALVAGAFLGDLTLAAVCLPFILATAVVLSATGNIISIHFPIRMARRGENPFASAPTRGCTNAFVSTLAFQLSLLIAAPIFLAAALPMFLHAPLAYGLSVPAALLYALGLYVAALKLYSTRALRRREPEILEECLVGEGVG